MDIVASILRVACGAPFEAPLILRYPLQFGDIVALWLMFAQGDRRGYSRGGSKSTSIAHEAGKMTYDKRGPDGYCKILHNEALQ